MADRRSVVRHAWRRSRADKRFVRVRSGAEVGLMELIAEERLIEAPVRAPEAYRS